MFLGLDKQEGDSVALKDSDGASLTYEELCQVQADIGSYVEPRSVVFCFCRNTVGAVAGYIGFIERGAVPLLLSERIDADLLSYLMEVYTPAYLWIPEQTRRSFPYEAICQFYGYRLLRTGERLYPVNDRLQLLMTTSGTTGSAKLVRYKIGNLEANAQNVASAFGWTKSERPVCDLGMQYTMGLNVINTHLYVGATLLLVTFNLTDARFWDFVKKECATNFTGVPFSYDILARLHFERMELPCLTTLAEGGGKLTDRRFKELADYAVQTGKRFIATFGTTETSARISFLPPELAREKIGSIGKAIPEGKLFLVDHNGGVIEEPEAEGELCCSGPNVTMGYALCREDLRKGDEWQGVYRTGDLARRDKDGCYYITGRKSRFLKLSGYRVSLDQAERLIQEGLGVECACTGTDQRMDIFITDNNRQKEVLDFISSKTGLLKTLFQVDVIEEIPRNDSGKIIYKRLGLYKN